MDWKLVSRRVSGLPLAVARTARVFGVVFAVAGCSGVAGIDSSLGSPISNDDTFALLSYLWGGARSAIQARREPAAGAFNFPPIFTQVPFAT